VKDIAKNVAEKNERHQRDWLSDGTLFAAERIAFLNRALQMRGSGSISEELYFDVYGFVAESAEYLQPSDKIRLLLPEIIVATAVATIFKGLLDGFLQRFGENLADATQRLIKRMIDDRTNSWIESPQGLVSDIDLVLPELTTWACELGEVRVAVVRELINLGFSDLKAEVLATEIIELIQQRLADGRFE